MLVSRVRRQPSLRYDLAVRLHQLPFRYGMIQCARPEIRHLDFSGEGLVSRPDALEQPGQRYGCVAEPAVLVSADVAFSLPERIQNSDRRSSLSGKIVQVQEME